jgi:transcription elongation factor SPT5
MGDYDDEKRKRKTESDEDDELEYSDVDDDSDEDSEEIGKPARKKRKTNRVSDLLLMEAEEDDDEDDDDDMDGDDLLEGAGEEIGGGSDTEENRSRARELFKNLGKDDDTALREMANRYEERTKMVEDFDEFPVDANDALAIRQSLLPTAADPTMWCIRCQEGKERDVVRDVLAKFLITEAGPREDRLHIFSVHCVDGDKGRIYVEARKESHVRTALAGVPFVRLTSPFKLLQRKEMPRVVVAPEKAQLEEGQWVRIKNGLYRDDLAQVYTRSEGGNDRIFLRLVPRISKEQYSGLTTGKRTRMDRAVRPPANPFRMEDCIGEKPEEVPRMGAEDNGEGQSDEYVWKGMHFKGGLLLKEFRVSGLHTANISPTQEELSRFKRAVSSFQKSLVNKFGAGSVAKIPTDEFDDFDALTNDTKTKVGVKPIVFAKGDHIQVTRGEYVSVTGIVTSATSTALEFRPDDTTLTGKRLISVPTALVRKYFAPGVHVKILTGVYAGETGTITSVQGDTATIYSDVVHKEISANMADLQIAFTTGSGNTSLGSYHLFDLVQLGDSVGVIVDVEREGFKILGENGQSKYVPLAEVGARRNMSRASIGDANNHYVNLGETVRILEGPYKDVTGILKHVSRSTVFIQCPTAVVRENRGLVCLRKHHIASVVDRSVAAPGANGAIGGGGGAMNGAGAGGAARGPAMGGRRIEPGLLKKEVIVKRGNWKGYRGVIKSATEREYTILLSTGSRTVKVPKEDVSAADAVQVGGGSSSYSQNNSWGSSGGYDGSQTPMRMQTPRHASSSGGDDFDPNYKPTFAAPGLSTGLGSMNTAISMGLGASSTSGGFQVPQTPGFPLPQTSAASVPMTPGAPTSMYSGASSMQGIVPMTPGGAYLPPVTPGAPSNVVPVTPGAPYGGFQIPQTPGVGFSVPQTPGASFAYPQTPGYGAGVPSTPGGPMAPSLLHPPPLTPGYAVPQTPGAMMPPMTPGAPPSLSSSSGGSSFASPFAAPPTPAQPAELDPLAWCQTSFEVYDTTSSQSPAPRYAILDPMKGTALVKVEALNAEGQRSGVVSNITKSSLKLVTPAKKDRVVIVTGAPPTSASIGTLIGIDEQERSMDGIFKSLASQEINVLPLANFAKVHDDLL